MVELRVARAPGRVTGGSTGVQISEAALRAPGRGLESLGQDIGQTGRFFQEFAKQKAVADDFKHRIEFESQRIKHDRNVREELRGVDEDKWVETYQTRMGEFLTGAGGASLKKMSGGGQERVGGNHKLWLENNITGVQTNAFKTSSGKIAASLDETLNERALMGDVPQGIADIDEAVKVRAISPAQGQARKEEFLGKVDNNRVDASILANPRSAREVIEDQLSGELKGQAAPYPNLSGPQLRAAHNRARAAEAQQKTNLYNEILLKSEVGDSPELFAGKSENQLWNESLKLHENGDISDQQLISLRNNLFDPASKEVNTAATSGIRRDISVVNFKNMSQNEVIDSYGEIEARIFEANLPATVESRLYRELQDKRDSKGAYADPESAIKITELEREITKNLWDDQKGKFFQGPPFFKEDEFDEDNPEHVDRKFQGYTDYLDRARLIHKRAPDMNQGDILDELKGRKSTREQLKLNVGSVNNAANNARSGRGLSRQGEFEAGERLKQKVIERILAEGGEVDIKALQAVRPTLPKPAAAPKPTIARRTRRRVSAPKPTVTKKTTTVARSARAAPKVGLTRTRKST